MEPCHGVVSRRQANQNCAGGGRVRQAPLDKLACSQKALGGDAMGIGCYQTGGRPPRGRENGADGFGFLIDWGRASPWKAGQSHPKPPQTPLTGRILRQNVAVELTAVLVNGENIGTPRLLVHRNANSPPAQNRLNDYRVADGQSPSALNMTRNREGRIIGRIDGPWLRDGTGKLLSRFDSWDNRTRDAGGRIVGTGDQRLRKLKDKSP
jgi:hypothetical protein